MTGMKSKKPKKKIKRNKKRFIWYLFIFLLVSFSLFLLYLAKDIPNPKTLSTKEYPESSQIFDRNQKLLYEFYSDQRRLPARLAEIPSTLIQATLAIEDANFYHHFGFDLKGILRGLYRTLLKKRLQGGSTITQQLVKNALLSRERTLTRKIKEAILTICVEILYSKDQILEMYFNQTPYGGNIWGVKAAAKAIFNRDLPDLNLAESALLAGLPGSPSLYSPFTNPEGARLRQQMVLTRMLELNYITPQQKDQAFSAPLDYSYIKNQIQAPHFVFYVKQKLIDKYGESVVNQGGLKIITTLDLDLQNYAQTIVASETGKLAKYNVSNGAVLVTQPKTGQILAMVGSKDYFATDIEGNFNVVTSLRQPGSSIKPLNYAVALELGKITPASIIIDEPSCFSGFKLYCPTNYAYRYFGLQTARGALASSLNVPAVKVLKLNGLDTFVASASAMGISTFKDPKNYGLSLTLGGGEVTMTDMATAFSVFANMGLRQDLHSILEVRDKNDKPLELYSYIPGERLLSRETSFLIQQILSDDGARSPVFGSASLLNIKGHPEVAVKTGTTNDLRDNWTIGYTPDFIVLSWVGNNNNTRMSGVVSGTSGAAPIWNKIMTRILTDKPKRLPAIPSGVIGINVCNLTGELIPDEGCDTHYEYFNFQFPPKLKLPLKNSLLINKDTGEPVDPGSTFPNLEWQEHSSVKDLSGLWYCFDCPHPTNAPSRFIP